MSSPIHFAQLLAYRAHAGQFRRDGHTPAITHPARVANRIAPLNLGEHLNERLQQAAWLHDSVGDGGITEAVLFTEGVPPLVIAIVSVLTRVKGERYFQDYIRRIDAHPQAAIVKIADILDNLTDNPTASQIGKYGEALKILWRHWPIYK